MSVAVHPTWPGSKKRVMRSFKLKEISNVGRPAQAGAVALLLKNGVTPSQPIRKVTPPLPRRNDGPASFEAAVQKFRDAGMSATKAMSAAHDRYPALLATYQAAGDEAAAKASAPPKTSAAVLRFRQRVEAIKHQRKVPHTKAMQLARDEDEEAFKAYQQA